MVTLPLFPLNAVLFPGTPISLYIFEDRYKLMMRECIDQERPFGVVLVQPGMELEHGAVSIHAIGCSAQISLVQRLNEGRMNIVAIGHERFRVDELSYDRPYLVGDVEEFPLQYDGQNRVDLSYRALQPWVERYIQLLGKLNEGELDLDIDKLPDDPSVYGCLAAYLLQVEPREKQPLLEAATLGMFLDRIRRLYRREVSLLETMIDAEGPPLRDSFSPN